MNAKQSLASLFLGALFGVGLMGSGMMQPQKVQDFLDFTGSWDPSLARVMGGAFLVSARAVPLIVRRKVSLIGHQFPLPTARDLDAKLIVGSALFGIGWGLGGFCPGPAIVGVATGSTSALLFALAMLVGMALHRTYHDLTTPSQ